MSDFPTIKNDILIPSNWFDPVATEPPEEVDAEQIQGLQDTSWKNWMTFKDKWVVGNPKIIEDYGVQKIFQNDLLKLSEERLLNPETQEFWLVSEQAYLKDLEIEMASYHDLELSDKLVLLDQSEFLATQYLMLTDTLLYNGQASQEVYSQVTELAQATYGLMAEFCRSDSNPNLQVQALLYESYAAMVSGDLTQGTDLLVQYRDQAMARLGNGNSAQGIYYYETLLATQSAEDTAEYQDPVEVMRAEKLYQNNQKRIDDAMDVFQFGLLQADTIIPKIKEDQIRAYQLGALGVWSTVSKEVYQKKMDELEGWTDEIIEGANSAGHFLARYGSLYGWFYMEDEPEPVDWEGPIRETYQREQALIQNLAGKMESGEALTIEIALEGLSKADQETWQQLRSGDYGMLLAYIFEVPPQPILAQELLKDAQMMEGRYGLPNSAYDIYHLILATQEDASICESAQLGIAALEGDSSILRGVFMTLTSVTSDDLVNSVPMMMTGMAARSLTRHWVTFLVKNSDKLGKLAPAIGWAAGVMAEAGVLLGYQLLTQSLDRDPEKLWTLENMGKGYATNLILLGAVRSFALAGGKFSPHVEQSLLFEKNSLKPFFENTFGLLGVFAGRNLNEAVGLVEENRGGEEAAIAKDVVKFLVSWSMGQMMKKQFPGYQKQINQWTNDAGAGDATDPNHLNHTEK